MFRRGSFKGFNGNQKKQMSIQKPVQPYDTQKPRVQKLQNLSAVVHSTKSTKFHVLTSGGNEDDKTILWKLNYPLPPGATIRKKHLVMKNIQYIISNWTEDNFPSVIYIRGIVGTQNINGYNKLDGTVTNRIAALQLSQVQATMDQSSVRTYDLKYVLRDSATWEIPVLTTDYTFKLSTDDSETPILCPLPNPITLNMQIRTQ